MIKIPAELIQAGGETLAPYQGKDSIIVPVHKKGDKADCNNYHGISLLSTHTTFYHISFFHGQVHTYMKLLGTISVDFDITDHLQIRLSAFVKYWRKEREYTETVHQLFIDFKAAYDSVRRDALYTILIEF
jgi:hypothetical protein